jgi:hypothetical protein
MVLIGIEGDYMLMKNLFLKRVYYSER